MKHIHLIVRRKITGRKPQAPPAPKGKPFDSDLSMGKISQNVEVAEGRLFRQPKVAIAGGFNHRRGAES